MSRCEWCGEDRREFPGHPDDARATADADVEVAEILAARLAQTAVKACVQCGATIGPWLGDEPSDFCGDCAAPKPDLLPDEPEAVLPPLGQPTTFPPRRRGQAPRV